MAVDWPLRVKARTELVGYRAEAATADGNLAALLAAIGDVPGTQAHTRQNHERLRILDMADDSTFGTVNHIVSGAAAAALEHFDEALDALQAAAEAQARLTLARLWLTLGRPKHAGVFTGQLLQASGMAPLMHAALVGGSPQGPVPDSCSHTR